MMNEYLMELPWEQGDRLYGLLGNLQYPAYIFILLWMTWKYPIPKREKAILWIIFMVARLWAAEMCPLLYTATRGFFPRTNLGAAFLLFIMIVAALGYMLKLPFVLALDTLVPAYILGRGLAILGCIFAGCCHGYPNIWGVYSRVVETVTFPTVLLDSITSVLITVYLMLLSRKQKYSGDGMTGAAGTVLFGILRVAIDILRDNGSLLTAEGICGIIYIFTGCLWYWRIRRAVSVDNTKETTH